MFISLEYVSEVKLQLLYMTLNLSNTVREAKKSKTENGTKSNQCVKYGKA